jgi:hypothetical protein
MTVTHIAPIRSLDTYKGDKGEPHRIDPFL